MSTKKMYAVFVETFESAKVFSTDSEAIQYGTKLSAAHPGRKIHVAETISIATTPIPAASWTKV